MNNVKTNPIGLDSLIQRVQNKLYTDLVALWTGTTLNGYGRCYVIENENSEKIVKYFKSKREYVPISVAEQNKFFFLSKSIQKKVDTIRYETNIELIFVVDLEKLKPTILHRADIEAQNDVEMILNQFYDVWVESIETGYENVFRGVKYTQENDLQPYHVFKFNLKVLYDMNETCVCGC